MMQQPYSVHPIGPPTQYASKQRRGFSLLLVQLASEKENELKLHPVMNDHQ